MKRIIPVVFAFAIFLSIVIVASGVSFQNVYFNGGLLTNSLEANFHTGYHSTGDYGTKSSTPSNPIYIKQCWVQLKEGSVDTGRKYSETAQHPDKTGSLIKAYVEKNNNFLHSCYKYWGWIYV